MWLDKILSFFATRRTNPDQDFHKV